MSWYTFVFAYQWIFRILIAVPVLFIIIRTPSLFMKLAMNQWDPQFQEELNNLYDEYNRGMERERTSRYKVTYNDDILGIPDVLDEKTIELKTIHDFIYSTLDKLQNEGDCEKKKIIRCSNSMLGGFGSTIHRHVICLHIAFALGRAFFIDQRQYRKFNGLANFTKLESGKCVYLKKNLNNIKDRCNFKDLNCYLNKDGFEIDNKYKLLEFTHEADFPAPRFIPGSLPYGIEKRLEKVGVKTPWHWFTSQLLGYMITRPNRMFQQKVNNALQNGRLHHPMVGLHYRGTDKIYTESQYISQETYINKAVAIFNEKLNSSGTRYIYVASDDSRMLKKMKQSLNESYVVKASPLGVNLRLIGKRADHSREEMEKILMDIYFLIRCDYVIVTFSSNIGRLIWELKTSQFPYHVDDKVISMDTGLYYGWYDYTALSRYYLTVRDNAEAIVAGKDEIMPYKKGQLYLIQGPLKQSIKTFVVNGIPNAVRHVRLRHSRKIGYVFEKDVIEWPGTVYYKNDLYK